MKAALGCLHVCKASAIACLLLLFASSLPASAFDRSGTLESEWSRVLSADIDAGPAVASGRIFCATSDGVLHCLDGKGAFLWSKPMKKRQPKFLTASQEGFVYAVSETGYVAAYNADGLFLWGLSGSRPPVFPPLVGRDGRLFLVYQDAIRCVSASGALKWSRPLPASPAFAPIQDGNGYVAIPALENMLFLISPFGELHEAMRIEPMLTAIAAIPDGFVCAFASGSLIRVSTGAASGILWKTVLLSPCASLLEDGGTLYAFALDGSVTALNATDGEALWSKQTGIANDPAELSMIDGSILASTGTQIAAVHQSGASSWIYRLSSPVRNPALLDGELLCGSGSDWMLRAYRVQTRISREKNTHKAENYGILTDTVPAELYMSPDPDREQADFFAMVADSLRSGGPASSEVYFARRLAAIAANTAARAFDRGRAAALLGQLGSFEYRPVLAAAGTKETDSSAMIGFLYGIASIGYDPDGSSLEAIQSISRNAGPQEVAVQLAVCDALYAIVRYSSARSAETSKFLATFAASPHAAPVRKHAISLLSNILN